MNFIIVTAELIQSIRDCAETSSFKQSENQCAETNTLKSTDFSQASFMLQAYAYSTLFSWLEYGGVHFKWKHSSSTKQIISKLH